jgi:hypothetical protein
MRLLYTLTLSFLTVLSIYGQAGLGLRQLEYATPNNGLATIDTADWMHRFSFGVHYRWFDASQPYSGNLLQQNSIDDNVHEIFNQHAMNIAFSYQYNAQWGATLVAPLVYNQKSSVLEHSLVNGTFVARQRRVTEGIGLGDVFVMVHWSPVRADEFRRLSLTGSVGVKIPTGDFRQTGTWYNVGPNRTSVIRPLDPIIQPGDGTWGYLADLHGSYRIMNWLGLYADGRYLATPAALNGTSTFRSTFSEQYADEEQVSVSDQFMIRGGVSLMVPNSPILFSFGVRVDGTPVNDVFGTSEGFRRPGFATAFESNFIIRSGKINFYLSIPYVYYQVREQSNAEKMYTARTGQFRRGEASFSRFMLMTGISSSF